MVYLQLYQWFIVLLIMRSSDFVLASPSASYNFIHLHDCPVCEAQYDYDFTIAVQLSLDNLEWSNSTLVNGSSEEGGSRMKPDTSRPVIQAIPIQCGKRVSPGEVAENASIVVVLTGECQQASIEPVAIVDAASLNKDLIEISYSPNIGELPSGPSSFLNNTIHMFPLQMSPATILHLLDFFGWKEAIVLTEPHTQIEELHSVVGAKLGTRGVSVVTLDSGNVQEPKKVLEKVLVGDYRVIIMNTYPRTARRLLCRAYRLKKMNYPHYIWLLPGWFEEDWWKEEDTTNKSDQIVCTQEEMKTMLKNSIGIMEAPSDYLRQNKLALLPFSAFNLLYTSMVALDNSTTKRFASAELAAFAYDSVWLLAAALSVHNVSSNHHQLTADDVISYSNTKDHYYGVSGDISFDDMGWRVARQTYVSIYRETTNHTLERTLIGIIKRESAGSQPKFMYINNESASTVWSGDEHPPIRIRINRIALVLTIIYYSLAALGILFAIFCIGFNLKYRNCKVIRLSSPNLNYITCAGAIVLLLSAFFIGSPSTTTSLFPFLCMGNVWAGAIGASLQYGTIQAKMFRVYVIFRRPGQKNIIIKDWHLAMYVAVLVTIDVIMLTVVTAIPEARSVGKLVIDQEHPPFRDATGVTVMSLIHDCESQQRGVDTYWFVLLFGYKLVLQIIVTVLAFLVCSTKVKIEALNDHRAVQAITYVNMVILIVSVVLAFAVSNYANAKAAVNGLSVLVGAYFNLSLVFLPKMYALYKDPKGRDIFRSPGNSTIAAATPEQSTTSSVASRRTAAKEEDTDASNSGCSPSNAVAGSNDKNGAVVVTNGMNHGHILTDQQPHPLSITNAYVSSPTSDDVPGVLSPKDLSEP